MASTSGPASKNYLEQAFKTIQGLPPADQSEKLKALCLERGVPAEHASALQDVFSRGGSYAEFAKLFSQVAPKVASSTLPPPDSQAPRPLAAAAAAAVPSLPKSIKLGELVRTLADQIHAIWQSKAPYPERWKPVKVSDAEIPVQAKDADSRRAIINKYLDSRGIPLEFRGDKHFRIALNPKTNVEIVEENILEIPNRHLADNNRAENDASAQAAIDAIREHVASGGKLDAAFVEQASEAIHVKWLERNGSWASDKQKLPFNGGLPAVEQEKDRDIVRLAIALYQESRAV